MKRSILANGLGRKSDRDYEDKRDASLRERIIQTEAEYKALPGDMKQEYYNSLPDWLKNFIN